MLLEINKKVNNVGQDKFVEDDDTDKIAENNGCGCATSRNSDLMYQLSEKKVDADSYDSQHEDEEDP